MSWPTTKAAWVQNLSVALVGAWLFLCAALAYARMPLYFWSEYRDVEVLPWALRGVLAIAPLLDSVPWAALVFLWALFRSLPKEGCGWSLVLMSIPGFFLSASLLWLAEEAFPKSVAHPPPAPDTVQWAANVVFLIGLVVFAIWQEMKLQAKGGMP